MFDTSLEAEPAEEHIRNALQIVRMDRETFRVKGLPALERDMAAVEDRLTKALALLVGRQ